MGHYIHGYSEREGIRLIEQSEILEKILHKGTIYEPCSSILEAGCGVGAQTVILAKNNPDSFITSVDISKESLKLAKKSVEAEKIRNVSFVEGDIMNLQFADSSFDHIFICFVLEHLNHPQEALTGIKRFLKPGGTITVIEGNHDACIWNPHTEDSAKVWRAMIEAQQYLGHDPNIGLRLYPLLFNAGYKVEWVEPRWVYADNNVPDLMNGVLNKIIVPMAKTAKEKAIALNLVDLLTWEKGIDDLEKVTIPPEGTFFYTWFKAFGRKSSVM
jgi:ubiquinone/menaquinone biosynthesis C-methylase UbiE